MAITLKVLPWLYRSKTNAEGKTPIYVRITKGSQRMEIATGHFIKESEWNSRSHTVKSKTPQARQINDHLQALRSKAFQLYNQLIEENKPFLFVDT